jgi:hypothetical protein
LLRFGTASFLKFKEAFSIAALIQFGDVTKLIELNSYYAILMPKESDYLIQGKPSMSKRLIDLACAEWIKANNRRKEKQAHSAKIFFIHTYIET